MVQVASGLYVQKLSNPLTVLHTETPTGGTLCRPWIVRLIMSLTPLVLAACASFANIDRSVSGDLIAEAHWVDYRRFLFIKSLAVHSEAIGIDPPASAARSEQTSVCPGDVTLRIRQFAEGLLDEALEEHLSGAACALIATLFDVDDAPFRSLALEIHPATSRIDVTRLSMSMTKPAMSFAFQRDYGNRLDQQLGFEHRVIRVLAHEMTHLAQRRLSRHMANVSKPDRERNAYLLEICLDYLLLGSTSGPFKGAPIPDASISMSAVRHSLEGARRATAMLAGVVQRWPLSEASVEPEKNAFAALCDGELSALHAEKSGARDNVDLYQ